MSKKKHRTKEERKDQLTAYLLGFLVVLLSVSIYNINAVVQGYSDQYVEGLIYTVLGSVAAVVILGSIILGPSRGSSNAH